MDNVAHTLTGAVLGEAGLKRLTGLGMPALLLSANIPDVDVFGMFFGANLAWRRGWTHGPLAMIALPVLLAAALVAFDRWQARRGTRPGNRIPVRPMPLLLLCLVGTLSHVLLDYLNTYGVRLLMPFSERWFYGDTLFIVDPWIWLGLGLGVRAARRRARAGVAHAGHPALIALVAAALYSGAMALGGRRAERVVRRKLDMAGPGRAEQVIASPVFADPLRRRVIVKTAEGLRFGSFRYGPGAALALEDEVVDPGMDDPAVHRAAVQDRELADFLYWSRVPYAEVKETACGKLVTVNDGRYSTRVDSGPFRVRVLLAGAPSASCPATTPTSSGRAGSPSSDLARHTRDNTRPPHTRTR